MEVSVINFISHIGIYKHKENDYNLYIITDIMEHY